MRCFVWVLGMGMAGSLLLGDVFRLESGSESPQLIELYTSEGCSSCPPAEKWLSGFLKDPGLWTHRVPVAFHVDYWDRLGWKDKYASRENTLRQYRFRDEGAVKSIYTPGFLVNGQEWRGWFQGRSIDEVRSKVADGKLIIEIDDGKLVAAYSGNGRERSLERGDFGSRNEFEGFERRKSGAFVESQFCRPRVPRASYS